MARPVTYPEEETIVAVAGALVLHVPKGVVSVRVMEEPKHTFAGPPIALGSGLTKMGNVVEQPVVEVNV